MEQNNLANPKFSGLSIAVKGNTNKEDHLQNVAEVHGTPRDT